MRARFPAAGARARAANVLSPIAIAPFGSVSWHNNGVAACSVLLPIYAKRSPQMVQVGIHESNSTGRAHRTVLYYLEPSTQQPSARSDAAAVGWAATWT